MATWTLEHIPAAGGASTTASLTAWGITRATITETNWDAGEVVLTLESGTALLADVPWAYRDKLILWRDGVRVQHLWVTSPARAASPQAEAQQVRVAGPWWWLAGTPMRDPDGVKDYTFGTVEIEVPGGGTVDWYRATGCTWETPAGDIVWATWDDQSRTTAQGQIRRALYAAIWAGAPITIGTISIDAPAPEQEVRNSTCASWVQSAAQYSPYSVGWWDHSGTTPAFCCAPRSGASAQSYALGDAPASIEIAPLHAQQAKRILLRYWYTVASEDGNELEFYYDDEAGDDSWPAGPGALIVDIDCGDRESAGAAWYVGVAARLWADLSPLAYAGSLALDEFADALPWYRPGHALNITGGRAEWATMAAIVQGVTWSISPEAVDRCTLTLGPPNHLGPSDWLELSRIGRGTAGASGRTTTGTSTPRPGTYDDLMPGGPAMDYSPTWSLEDEQKYADCHLLGYAEYTDPSTPTRYYLTETLAGGGSFVTTQDGAWVSTKSAEISGASMVNPSTGSVSSTKRRHYHAEYPTSPTTDTVEFSEVFAATDGGVIGPDGTITETPTVRTFEQVDTIDVYVRIGSTLATSTLSAENTEQDEIARAKLEEEWEPATANAIYTARTTLRSFTWRMLRRRATTVAGLKPWSPYLITFKTETCAIGSSEWVAGPDVTVSVTADIDGNASASDWAELEPERGYEARWGTVSTISAQT